MRDLPKAWIETSLGNIVQTNPRHPSELDGSTEVSFVPMAGISDSSWKFNFSESKNYSEVRKNFTHFVENDVLFAKITPSMENGKASVAKNLINGLGCGTTELHVLRSLCGVEPKYIYYYINQETFRQEAARSMTGTAGQLRVPVRFLQEVNIPLPPLNEQRRIVAKLERLLQKVDICKERLEKIPAILRHFRQSILSGACSGYFTADWREKNPHVQAMQITLAKHAKATAGRPRNKRRMRPARGLTLLDYSSEIPATWSWCKIRQLVRDGAIIDVQDGNHGELYPRKTDFGDVGIPYILAENVINDQVGIAEAPKLLQSKANELRIGFSKPGDVLLTHNATVGRVAVVPDDAPEVILSTSTTYYRVDNTILDREYLATVFRSYYFQNQLNAIMEQTTRNQVSVTKQVELSVQVPPIGEQKEIVKRCKDLFDSLHVFEQRYEKAKACVDRLTQSILSKTFRGKLIPQDPNDEPASVLLESIRKERAKQEGEMRGKKRPHRKRQGKAARTKIG